MSGFFLRRLLGLIPLFFGITLISFVVIHLAPGSAADAQGLNPQVSLEARQKLEKLYGLDRPLMTQYAEWVRQIIRFDFGRSLADGQPVSRKIAEAIPITLAINGISMLLVLLIGVPLGVYGAVHRGSLSEKVLTTLLLAAFAVPGFWLSLVLIRFFGVTLRWLPVSGLTGLFFDDLNSAEKIIDVARHLAMPIAVTTVSALAGISLFMKSSLEETLRQNYIRTARAKGLDEETVLYKHALRNALFPVITIVGLSVPGLLGGSVVLESLFSLPGMGQLFFSSVFSRDYPVVMGVLVLGAFLTLLGNFLADLAYHAVDPRLRSQR